MADWLGLLQGIEEKKRPGMLATIVAVEGSAYRKAGAAMAFWNDGSSLGVLSAGCLEQDLAERVHAVWEHGTAQTAVFDLRAEDDLSWGQGPGCNGKVTVLMEPLDESRRRELANVRMRLEQGVAVTLCKEYDGGQHVQVYEPRPRLLLFGAAPDARPLAIAAAQVHFSVTVADWREGFCKKEHFPQAERLIVGRAEELVGRADVKSQDYAVLMTHHFQQDRLLLRELLRQEVRYLGVLGPRARTSRLLEGEDVPEHLHNPVGLAIGAQGPEEIAASIVAELIKVRRAGRGRGEA
ncbi:XdhC family protein [Tumebacillus flagellatus]|uniref:Xanthine dehydrogenase n=1 Tax=Tumebacillus flagellatus TaxID=1157490 RepID=A0A074LSW4_9BACL|nr:XdhC family protein [Tumebacillus flagellatus]KEO85256.1 hypothetical protein EL26_01475 [Tumebacillus flagellatus]